MYICPKCGAVACYNSYFGRVICTECSWQSDLEQEIKDIMSNKNKCADFMQTLVECLVKNNSLSLSNAGYLLLNAYLNGSTNNRNNIDAFVKELSGYDIERLVKLCKSENE